MKSVMGELTDSTNRAEGFALMPVVWGLGATLGYVNPLLNLRVSIPCLPLACTAHLLEGRFPVLMSVSQMCLAARFGRHIRTFCLVLQHQVSS